MIKFAVWVFTVVPLAAALALAVDLIPKHGLDMSWSAHARFHATWASAKFFAMGIIVVLIAQNALKRAEPWAWWAMAVYLVIGIGGMIPAMIWQTGGSPPLRPLIMVSVMAAVMILALATSARAIFFHGGIKKTP